MTYEPRAKSRSIKAWGTRSDTASGTYKGSTSTLSNSDRLTLRMLDMGSLEMGRGDALWVRVGVFCNLVTRPEVASDIYKENSAETVKFEQIDALGVK